MAFHVDVSDAGMARVTFELVGDHHVSAVSVVGSFNDWTPGVDELRASNSGTISATVEVPYGQDVYFRYLSDDQGWFDDPEAEPAGGGSRIDPIQRAPDSQAAPAAPDTTIDLSEPAATQGAPASPARQ